MIWRFNYLWLSTVHLLRGISTGHCADVTMRQPISHRHVVVVVVVVTAEQSVFGTVVTYFVSLFFTSSFSFHQENSLLEEETDQGSSFLMKFTNHRSPWTVVSVVMIVFMTFNLALEMVHARQYFPTTSAMDSVGQRHGHKQGSLGSAAISSITETLSPILPFTGGVDLRREFQEQVDKTWYDTASSVVSQVRDAFGLNGGETTSVFQIPRGGASTAGTKVMSSNHYKNNKRKSTSTTHYPSPISDSKPFYPLPKIADLTLSDLTELFQYAMEQNRAGFDRSRFLSKVSEKVKPVIIEMDAAVTKSRGGVQSTTTLVDTTFSQTGHVDALYFCAILRLFAEWRIVRQVPEGYKGYAVGMNLGHKDIVQNLGKLETAVHQWLEYRRQVVELQQHYDSTTATTLTSPTLRDLLEHEIDQDVHSKLPRLKEKSAAMGLLWVRRQLHYQTCLFRNILQVPSSEFPTSHAAVSHAYSHVYGNYHGWAVQKIFNYSFQAAPDVTEIYKYMNPLLLEQVMKRAQRITVVETVNDYDSTSQSSTLDDDDTTATLNNKKNNTKNPLERLLHHIGGELDKLGKHVGGEIDKFGKHIGGEWDKLVDNVVRVLDQDASNNKKDATRVRGGAQEEMDRFVCEQMEQDAHARISLYLTQVEPLLDDLEGLFDDLNMDDPTKVETEI